MNNKDYFKLLTSCKWIKITYKNWNCSGSILMKEELLESKIKKLNRLLKGFEWHIEYNYILTFEEYCDHDVHYNSFVKDIKRYKHYYEYYSRHQNEEYMNEYLKLINDSTNMLHTYELELKEKYEILYQRKEDEDD